MAMTFTTNQIGANTDYMKYVSGQVVKTDKVNNPDLLDFTLVNYDSSMVKLVRGAHIVITTSTYGVWFAGFITKDPEVVYLGTNNNVPQWQFTYEASGEEYMLNQKPLGIMPPFINTTQGAIIKALISRLSPAGFSFNTTGIQNGQNVPRFVADPNKHFTEIVHAFAKAAHFQFQCKNFVATFVQQDSVAPGFTVDGNSQHFTPASLNLKAAGDPIVNDSIILGAIEPQNYLEEYFMGDGATAQFSLISSVFGVDSTLLLQDDFSGSSIDSSKWTIYDTSAVYLLPYGGSLNVLGGSNTSTLDVYLQSQSLVPLEGNLRITHGEWDFISACDGILGGLWTGPTVGSLSGLLFGIRAVPSGTLLTGTTLNPVVNGIVDATQAVVIDYNKRYVMRSLYTCGEAKRAAQDYAYKDSAGVVHQVTLPTGTDHFYVTTIITEVDPITALPTNQWTWTNDMGVLSTTAAYYVPVASNNLNLTVSSLTISVPMQASLSAMASGTTKWVQTIIGPNEIDSLDGMAPAATIVDSNNGASTRNSFLGSANYNPGQATLTYFKNTAQLKSYLPNKGDIVHLAYRSAGAAIGRAQSKTSIAAEAAAWGDDGIRSETKRDYNPLPRTSAECELAATARVNDCAYQHWSGTYTMPSGSWFTAEPTSGTIIPFVNLPAQFPSYLQSEEIVSVKSTLVSLLPTEIYIHEINFGPQSTVENVLAAIKVTNDVFTPQDTAEIPQFIDVSSLGSTSLPSVPKFLYTNRDSWLYTTGTPSYWHYTFNDALPSTIAGVEIRYTDNGWGADDGNNLIARIPNSATTFSIPRTVRGKVAYLRSYDQRNICHYSEDITQHTTKSASITTSKIRYKGPSNSPQMVGLITSSLAGASLSPTITMPSTTPAKATFTMSVLGIAGKQISFGFAGYMQTVTCTGKWQRVSVTGTSVSQPVIIPISLGYAFYTAWMSVEIGTQETIYCKTNATSYGAVSRFSTGLHTALPMIPPSPTATGNFSKINAPVISVVLPANLTDVWGCEIRAADNTTVLFHTDLVNATLSLPTVTGSTSMVLTQTAPALSRRSYSYWVYTYNLFGEYSTGYNFAGTLNPPSISNLNVVNAEKLVVWTGSNATAYELYVDKTDATLQDLTMNPTTINTFYPLPDTDFFGLRYIAVTPYDALGPGVTVGGYFEYLPDSLTELTTTEVIAA